MCRYSQNVTTNLIVFFLSLSLSPIRSILLNSEVKVFLLLPGCK